MYSQNYVNSGSNHWWWVMPLVIAFFCFLWSQRFYFHENIRDRPADCQLTRGKTTGCCCKFMSFCSFWCNCWLLLLIHSKFDVTLLDYMQFCIKITYISHWFVEILMLFYSCGSHKIFQKKSSWLTFSNSWKYNRKSRFLFVRFLFGFMNQ